MSTSLLNLLFAQTIYKHLTDNNSTDPTSNPDFFNILSQSLKQHPLNPDFNLSPSACQSLYNALLPNKNNATIAMLHPLLGKLYESYKRDIIQGIRHDEQEYRKKVDEIKEIEEGKWGDNELLREMGREQQVLEIQRLQLLRQMRLEMAQKQLRLEKRGGLNYHANSSQQHQTPSQAIAHTTSNSPDIPTKSNGAIAATRSLSPERNIPTKIDLEKEERSKSESPTLTAASQNTKALQHQQLQQQLQQHKLQQLQQQQLQKQQLIQQQLKQQQQQKVLQLQQALAQAQKVKNEQKPEEKTQEEVKQAKLPVESESAKSTQERGPASVVEINKESKLVQEAAANGIDKSEFKNNDVLKVEVVESTNKNDEPTEPAADAKPVTSKDSNSDSKQPELSIQQADKEAEKEGEKSDNFGKIKPTETQLPSTQKEVKFAENLEEVKTLPEEMGEEETSRSVAPSPSGKVKENEVNKEEDKATDKEAEEWPTEEAGEDEQPAIEPSDEPESVEEKLIEADLKDIDESKKVEKIITEPEKLATEKLAFNPSPDKPQEVNTEILDTGKDTGSSTEPEEREKSESALVNKNHNITEISESSTDSTEIGISEKPKLQEPGKSDDAANLADKKQKSLGEFKEAKLVAQEESPKDDSSDIRKDKLTISTEATDEALKAEQSEEVDKDADQVEEIEAQEKGQKKKGTPVTDSFEPDEEKKEAKTEVDSKESAKPESFEVSGESEELEAPEEPEATNEEEEKEEQKPVPEPRVTRSTAKTLDKEAAAAAEATRPTVRTRSSSRVRNKTPEVKEDKPTKEEEDDEEESEEEVRQDEKEKEVKTENVSSEPEEPEPEPRPKGTKRAAVEKRESARLKKAKLEESVEKTTQAEHPASEESEAEDAAASDKGDNEIKDEEKEGDNEAEEEEELDHDKEPEEEEEEEAENDESPGPPTKRTRSMSSAKKRKRQYSPPRSTPNRRFLTMVNPLLSNISSNKSASFFSNPVNPNDAPNYYDLIYYPTDIRTIKAQVKDGRIRDTAELERQLQRMFANAVMYNGWDSDVSMWTREMQHDTETLLALFRGAERTSAVNSEKGSMASGDEDSSKRRKK
jgi:hypothetical protein